MDWVRLGAVIRALRRRRRWRQRDLGGAARLSQQSVSRIERGRLQGVDLATFDRLAVALDARLDVRLAWRGGELDRLLDERHAALVEAVVGRLAAAGWEMAVEVTYAEYAERGAIDVLGWFSARRALLVVEVKTMLASIEATHRRHDEKVRLAAAIARRRFGWSPVTVSRLLVLPDDSTICRRSPVMPGRSTRCCRCAAMGCGSGCASLSDGCTASGSSHLLTRLVRDRSGHPPFASEDRVTIDVERDARAREPASRPVRPISDRRTVLALVARVSDWESSPEAVCHSWRE